MWPEASPGRALGIEGSDIDPAELGAPADGNPRRPGAPRLGLLAALSLSRSAAPSITVHSHTVPVSGLLTFTADGFTPGATLGVVVDYASEQLGAFSLDGRGGTSEACRVPIPATTRPGVHVLTFSDGTVDFDLLIDASPTRATVTIEPAAVTAGAPVRFAGRGFPPGGTVHVKVGAGIESVAFPIAPDGTIAATLPIPSTTPAGVHEIRFLASSPPTSTAVPITVAADLDSEDARRGS